MYGVLQQHNGTNGNILGKINNERPRMDDPCERFEDMLSTFSLDLEVHSIDWR